VRAWIYDRAILPLTSTWYAEVLGRLPDRARLLDVGIGTGGALVANADLVKKKQLRVHGIDIDADYVRRCRHRLAMAGLDDRVHVAVEPVQQHLGGPYEAIYFSASFMLLPAPPATLRHVGRLLAPDGRIYFTQTFEEERSALAEAIKPLLRFFTTIDFGRVTYEDEFRRTLAAGGTELLELITLRDGRRRSHRLAIARPEST
jgi:SAM-dependent methyltransferase